ncbi:MAG: hypothetical protein AAFP92_18445 [Bacteroidota bacterium]
MLTITVTPNQIDLTLEVNEEKYHIRWEPTNFGGKQTMGPDWEEIQENLGVEIPFDAADLLPTQRELSSLWINQT